MTEVADRVTVFRPMKTDDLDTVMAIERGIYAHPWTRGNFSDSLDAGYYCWIAESGSEIVGYGVVRQCQEGWKVGPLFAENVGDAETILRGLLTKVPEGTFFLDTPGTNQAAVDLAVSLGLKPMFETARMYRGPAPEIDTAKVFGITTFELG